VKKRAKKAVELLNGHKTVIGLAGLIGVGALNGSVDIDGIIGDATGIGLSVVALIGIVHRIQKGIKKLIAKKGKK
jgi:hypothetical protein